MASLLLDAVAGHARRAAAVRSFPTDVRAVPRRRLRVADDPRPLPVVADLELPQQDGFREKAVHLTRGFQKYEKKESERSGQATLRMCARSGRLPSQAEITRTACFGLSSGASRISRLWDDSP